MKIKSVILVHSIVFPGASLSGDSSVSVDKYPGIKLEIEDQLLYFHIKGRTAATPLSNVKSIVFEQNELTK